MMKYLLLLVLVLKGWGVYAQDKEQQAKAFYFQAEALYDSESYTKALEHLDKSAQLLGSSNASIEALRVKIYHDRKDYKRAKQALTTFYSHASSNELQSEMAPYLMRVDSELEKALAAEKKKEAERRAKYEEYMKEGDRHLANREWLAAERSYEKAKEHTSNASYIDTKIGEAKEGRRQAIYQKNMTLGREQLEKRQYGHAKASFEAAMDYAADQREVKEALADVEERRNASFRKHTASGDQHFEKKEFQEAKSAYKAALEFIPGDAQVRDKLNKVEEIIKVGVRLEDLVDPRDGSRYGVIRMGSQVWLADNMRYKSRGSVCNKALKADCGRNGYLYPYSALDEVCPRGWHIPTKAEWTTLLSLYENKQEAYDYLADAKGFKALQAGGFSSYKKFYPHNGNYWSATQDHEGLVYVLVIGKYLFSTDGSEPRGGDAELEKYNNNDKLSCRCIRD